ncbi:HAD-IA family hydrolase [Rhodospirillaceae bacterium KN72]|uniref:HAD-IA family hydrolase n=1 Tax=Pacificispira spongiicola TaxID=2729598 RepID=A0A7Y0E3S0_9PROT|nr:HAD-IA family hydrolase [Pacificispira spongiicola]NMM46608.1 HAD-IA family hydrolase [Pacificispira spongiicola]
MDGGPYLIVFDCDGTLVDSGHIIVDTMSAAWRAEGLTPPAADDIRHQIGLPLGQAIANLHPDGDRDSVDRLCDAYKNVFVSGRNIGAHQEPLYDGCADVLALLAAEDAYLLGVATGKGRRGLDHTLERHGIGRHFHVLKTADDGPGKPNPHILQDAMAETGASPWNTVVIGDTIFDIGMAVSAGAHAIGVSWGYHPPHELRKAGARSVADLFHDIPALVREIWTA